MGNVKCEGVLKHVQNNVTIASNYSKLPSFLIVHFEQVL